MVKLKNCLLWNVYIFDMKWKTFNYHRKALKKRRRSVCMINGNGDFLLWHSIPLLVQKRILHTFSRAAVVFTNTLSLMVACLLYCSLSLLFRLHFGSFHLFSSVQTGMIGACKCKPWMHVISFHFRMVGQCALFLLYLIFLFVLLLIHLWCIAMNHSWWNCNFD